MPRHPVPWEASPHTKAKHALYTQYLNKWMPIMIRGWKADITYAEGFAGPGIYLDGSPGSPVIALRSLVTNPTIRTDIKPGGVRFIFVDQDPRSIAMLPGELAKAADPVPLQDLDKHGVRVVVEQGDCEPDLERILSREKAWHRPILAVLDTWGGAVSHKLVSRIASNPGSEVIITMQPQYFSRFAGTEDITHGDAVFGDKGWRSVIEQPSAVKERWLLQRYRQAIGSAGFDFVLDFELVDARGQSLFLVFGSTHLKGLRKMKEAMWEVDDLAGVGYRDPRDPGQQTLEITLEPQTAPLRRLILDHLRTLPGQCAALHQLRSFALHKTVFKESQASGVVSEMVGDGELVRLDGASAGARLWASNVVSLPRA